MRHLEGDENMNWGIPSTTRIVDWHGHLGYYNRTKIIPTNAEAMLRVMDRVGIDKTCISGFLSIGPDCKVGNDMVAEAVRKYPHRFGWVRSSQSKSAAGNQGRTAALL